MEEHAGDFAWTFEDVLTDDDYNLRMIRFVGNETGGPLFDDDGKLLQGRLRPLLIVHTATNDCLSWLTATEAGTDSIPKILFSMGYDVFLGCRRGTEFSRSAVGVDLETKEGEKLYFDFNTQSVGDNDIPAMVQRVNEVYNSNRVGSGQCESTQLLTHGLGAAEVAAALAANPTLIDSTRNVADQEVPMQSMVAKVTNVAPCAVTTYQQKEESQDEQGHDGWSESFWSDDHGWRRILRALDS